MKYEGSTNNMVRNDKIVKPASKSSGTSKGQANYKRLQLRVKKLEELVAGSHEAPLIHKFADYVNTIGLKESITARYRCLKTTWAILFCLGLAATLYFIYAIAKEYFEDPTVTKVKVIEEESYEYPPIVFCNDAWYDLEKARSLNFSNDAVKYSLGYWRLVSDVNITNPSQAKQEFYNAFQKNGFTTLLQFFEAIAVDFVPIKSRSEFARSKVPAYLTLSSKTRFEKIFFFDRGICFSYIVPPASDPLRFIDMVDHARIIYSDRSGGLARGSPNWNIILANDARALFSWSTTVFASTKTSIKIKANRFIALNRDKSPCRNDDEEEWKNYSSDACMVDCLSRGFKQQTKCQFLWMATVDRFKPPAYYCNQIDNPSLNDFLNLNASLVDLKKSPQCLARCPHQCERITYEAVVDGTDDILQDKGATKEEVDAIQKRNVTLNAIFIYHDAFERHGILTFTEVRSYTFTALVSNIGGTFGLFIGGTIFTIAQLILFFVDYLWQKRQQKKNGDPKV